MTVLKNNITFYNREPTCHSHPADPASHILSMMYKFTDVNENNIISSFGADTKKETKQEFSDTRIHFALLPNISHSQPQVFVISYSRCTQQPSFRIFNSFLVLFLIAQRASVHTSMFFRCSMLIQHPLFPTSSVR